MWRFYPPPTIEQSDNNNGSSNDNGNNGGTENGGGGEQENGTKELRHLFFTGFGDNPNGMYFALHITGKSEINPNTKLGLFAQNATNATQGKMAYARDLEMQFFNIGNAQLPLSKLYEQHHLQDVYSIDYGWTDEKGLKLDMPFYLGTKYFYTDNNYFNFENFVIEDMTVPGEFMGFAYMIRCNSALKFDIQELDKKNENVQYDPTIYKNIALLTIEFRDGKCQDYSVTLDGFVEK